VLQGLGGLDAQPGGVLEEGPAVGQLPGGTGVLGGTGRAGEGAAGGPASGPGSVGSGEPLASSNAMSFAGMQRRPSTIDPP
jgi:hypothetical protein